MELYVPFKDLNSYIAKRFDQPLSLSFENDKEVKVTYTRRILIKDVKVNVKLHIDEVREDSITLTYDGAFGLDMLLSGALSFFKSQFPELSGGIHPEDNHRICVNLSEINKAKAVVENVALGYIKVFEDGLKIGFSLKIPKSANPS